MKKLPILLCFLLALNTVSAQTYYPLNGVPNSGFVIDWSDPNLITTNNDWSNIPYLRGFRGDALTSVQDVDPRTITEDGTGTPVVIFANQSDPNTFNADGFAEFESISNPCIAFRASNTASAPFLMMYFNTLNPPWGYSPGISFVLRDIDGTDNNAIQQVVVQYRVGESGPFITANQYFHVFPTFDFFGGYHPDATKGPFLQGHESFCEFIFPPACNNQPKVQIRIMITNASGGNEWVGIDDIRPGGAQLLPIKLHSFSAAKKNGSVILNWNATSENTMEHFEIERSTDGVNYIKLADVYAKGIGNYDYSFADASPVKGNGFYRLKLINNDGRFIYSDILNVKYLPKDVYISALYPAVTNSKINLVITSGKNLPAVLLIENIQGAVIKKFSVALTNSSNNIPLDVSSLPTGNYFIRLNVNGDSFTERFIKQ
ncbi:MAG: T9SS type A sorting domain-containing protein [Ferruginibacter sp.]